MDDEDKKPDRNFQIGQDISSLSVEELSETVELLRNEIDRLETAKKAKSKHLADAESLFNTKN